MGASTSTQRTKRPLESISGKTFDYIVVGGGTAGCVLASRLSENPDVTVCVIEAGKSHEPDIATAMPLAFGKTFGTDADWGYRTIPQKHAGQRELHAASGKILGGCSSTNCAVYHRSAPDDFEDWERQGACGWGFQDLLPYFLKAETYTPRDSTEPGKDRGQTGFLKTRHPDLTPGINAVMQETLTNLGVPQNDDACTSSGTMGHTAIMACTDALGRRSSAATAYLSSTVLDRPNLTVVTRCKVEKILVSDDLQANGVQASISKDGPSYFVFAGREVVLCAGAIGTPLILLASGIGPQEDLENALVHNLPAVGRNLYEHATMPLHFRVKANRNLTWDYLSEAKWGALANLQWFFTGGGPMSTPAFIGAAFLKARAKTTKDLISTPTYKLPPVRDMSAGPSGPDLELIWGGMLMVSPKDTYGKQMEGVTGFSMGAVVLKPRSHGTVKMRGTVWDGPLIDYNLFSDESNSDMNVLIRATRLMLRAAHTDPLASSLEAVTEGDGEWWFPAHSEENISDEMLRQYIRTRATTSYHPIGTARMGTNSNASVVDLSLRVHGMRGLRVVDASVFPNHVSGHPCAVVVAVAERAAEMIQKSL